MVLRSEYLGGDPKLEAAASSHPAHITPRSSGDHVGKIQRVLITLDNARINIDELQRGFYGDDTTAAVLRYKQQRNVVNKSYQQAADNIVGIMTMKQMDDDLFNRQMVDPDSDFIGFTPQQIATIRSDLELAKRMIDNTIHRLANVSRLTDDGTMIVTPRTYAYYDTKLKLRNIFRINIIMPDDSPVPDETMDQLRRNFRRLRELPAASTDPLDGINFLTLRQRFINLRQSLDRRFLKEFYQQSTFKGDQLTLLGAFVAKSTTGDQTVRFKPSYFDALVHPQADDRAVTVAHERAHTALKIDGHPGTGYDVMCTELHMGHAGVATSEQALGNAYCYEWLIRTLMANYNPTRFYSLNDCEVVGSGH